MVLVDVIGKLIGTIGTFIITKCLRSVGTTELYVNSWNIKYYKISGSGGMGETTEPLESDCDAECSLDINLYNSADVPMSLREVRLKFVGDNYEIKSELFDSSTKKYQAHTITMNPVGVINIPPKEFVWLKLEGIIKKDDIKRIFEGANVYFSALDYKGIMFCKEIVIGEDRTREGEGKTRHTNRHYAEIFGMFR